MNSLTQQVFYLLGVIPVQFATRYRVNSSPPGKNGRDFADGIFRCIFVNKKFGLLIKISRNFVPQGPIDNNPALV